MVAKFNRKPFSLELLQKQYFCVKLKALIIRKFFISHQGVRMLLVQFNNCFGVLNSIFLKLRLYVY